MNLTLIVLAVVMSALGACVRYVLMEYCRTSVVSVNALASVAIGACIGWFGVAVANQPIEHMPAWLSVGFLAGFSTVSGQVAWVYQYSSKNWQRLALLAGLVAMAATLGGLGYGVALWLM